jgi:hypothetical protein
MTVIAVKSNRSVMAGHSRPKGGFASARAPCLLELGFGLCDRRRHQCGDDGD